MEGRRENEDIGEWIRNVAAKAVESMEFGQLNQVISDTVNTALDEVKAQTAIYKRKIEEFEKKSARPLPLDIRVNWVGKVSGILLTVFGGIGTGIFGILTLVFLVIAITSHSGLVVWWWVTGMMGIGLAGFLTMLGTGIQHNSRIGRLKKYVKELKRRGKSYCELKQLNRSVAKSLPYVRKDMKKMLALGMLPDARMDDEETCLILDEDTYRQYCMARDSFAERQKQDRGQAAEESQTVRKNQSAGEGDKPLEAESVSEVIAKGESYMNQLDKLRESMPGQPIREKLIRLDTILERLFQVLKKHPEQLDELERFMEYYLPTTVKLVTLYQEFSEVEFPGENICQAKKEIEQTLETINDAFEKLLDDIYQDTAFDVLTDVSVLQSMLARDGLTEPDLKGRMEEMEE